MKDRIRYADTVLVIIVVAIAAMLIIPLPTALLDILLVVNISFSILLLLVGLYLSNVAALYTFPTILLLSTLFRLGLNVASSRLILSQGDAGRVIEAFGIFLIRGEVVVGVIIFSIVTIVNFIVIAKGSSRVSEVAARFALDSLPGKQISIDNDARAGLISADEARQKRDDLRRESQLYGSMDGAMKFVQGDALAGFFIIVTNIVGGVYLGLSKGLSFTEAIQTYTVLTVGDGLVTQIPGLLTSICAGIVVTRVSSSESATLSGDLNAQLFSHPASLIVTGIILLIFAILPGIPSSPFLMVGAAAVLAGSMILRKRHNRNMLGLTAVEYSGSARLPTTSGAQSETEVDDNVLVVVLDSGVLFRAYKSNSSKVALWWQSFRSDFLADVGILLPDLRIVPNDLIAPSSYSISKEGVEMFSGTIPADAYLVEICSSQAALLGIEVLVEEEHPISGNRVFWAPNTPALRKMLDAAAIKGSSFFEYIGLRIGSFCLKHPEEFFSVTNVHSLLRQIDKKHPGLIGEGFGKEFVSLTRLTAILQELVRQGVSIRDFRGVIEGIASYCAPSGAPADGERNVDISGAVTFVRNSRRRQILRRFVGTLRSLRVVVLSSEVEQLLDQLEYEDKYLPLPIEGSVFDLLSAGIHRILRPALELGVVPMAIVCRSEHREKVLLFVQEYARNTFVLSYEELEPAMPVEQVGIWALV